MPPAVASPRRVCLPPLGSTHHRVGHRHRAEQRRKITPRQAVFRNEDAREEGGGGPLPIMRGGKHREDTGQPGKLRDSEAAQFCS
jgi:hypothetical protein